MLKTIPIYRSAKIMLMACMFLIMLTSHSFAQEKGPDKPEFNPDTVFIFQSPRPLLNLEELKNILTNAWGIDIVFSGNGFAGGVFMQKKIQKGLYGFIDLYLSGARKSEEFELYDRYGQLFVPYKINRLYMFPLMFGVSYRLFQDKIIGSFKPFISAGIGPTFILSTPYNNDVENVNKIEIVGFFESFGSAKFYTRAGGFVGIGTDIHTSPKNVSNIEIRYYLIPFGGDGLESIIGLPITDFGGIFLSLSIGFRY